VEETGKIHGIRKTNIVLLDDAGLHLYGIPLSKTQFEAQHKHIWLDAIKQTYWTVGTCDD